MSNLLKNLLIALTLAIVLVLGYVMFFRGDQEQPVSSLQSGSNSAEAEIQIQQIVAQINQLNEYTIDGTLFGDPTFTNLIYEPSRTQLGVERAGRSNPFAPVE